MLAPVHVVQCLDYMSVERVQTFRAYRTHTVIGHPFRELARVYCLPQFAHGPVEPTG